MLSSENKARINLWTRQYQKYAPYAQAAGEGAAASVGFFRNPAGKMKFLGGSPAMKSLAGAGFGLGLGYAAYKATGDPLMGVAVGGATTLAITGLGGMKGALKGLGPVFTMYSMYEGYKEGGVGGAIWGGVKSAASWAAFDVGIKLAKSTTIGRIALNPWTIGVAAIGAGAYFATKKFAEYGRQSRRSEFTGNMGAFMTDAAVSMRQRAVSEISRSHTNSRTILGSEATLMHF